jgi:hypothetical protein
MRCCIASSIMSSSDQHNSALARSPGNMRKPRTIRTRLKRRAGWSRQYPILFGLLSDAVAGRRR